MFEKMGLIWVGLSRMDILLVALSCVTAVALYAAFVV